MPQTYIGEIRMFSANFAPTGWLLCNGDLLEISENEQLFQVIGTTYGGDGTSTFALPDLRGRLPIHSGNGFALAQAGGVEAVALTTQQLPAHTHALRGTQSTGTSTSPQNNVLARTTGSLEPYIDDVTSADMSPLAVASVGAGGAHTNMQPYRCVHFIISVYGSLPTA